MKGMSYSDVLSMPTYERRYFLSLLTKDVQKREEQAEAMKEQAQVKTGKGSRQTRVSGNALKTKLQSGEVK